MRFHQPTFNLAGMTCAFTDPVATRTAWSSEAFKLVREFQVQLEETKRQASQPSVLKLTRKRLEKALEPVEFQIQALEHLLRPLLTSIEQRKLMSYLSESPGPSWLSANYENLFRDWAWGEKENADALACVNSVLETGHNFGRLAVLGAGGGRLAYDLHQTHQLKQTVVSDFNPLLMLAAQKIVRGETLELVEFPLMPSEGDQFSIRQKLKAPAPVGQSFTFAMTDATRPGFTNEEFDTVLTPWLIDVVKMDLAEFLPQINQLLPLGGTWLNFGPLGFNNPRIASHYAVEEVRYLIQKSGFEIRREQFERIPYMQNPSSNSHRLEKVWTVSAVKVKSCEVSQQPSKDLFSWEQAPDAPIEVSVDKLNLVNGHAFTAEVLAMVDGQRSFNEIVQHLVQVKSLSAPQAAHILRQMLLNVETLAQRNPLRRGF